MSYGELKQNRNLLLNKRVKAHLILIFSTNTNWEIMAYRSFHWKSWLICNLRGVRKVTTGITGLWQPRVHIDVAFWFFDVGSSYSRIAAGSMDKIVHLLTGNVSWVKIIILNPHLNPLFYIEKLFLFDK